MWTVGAHLIPLPLLAESALIEFCLLSDWQRLAKQGSIGWFGFFPLIGTANNFKDTPAFFYGSMWLPLALGTESG